MNPYGTTVRTEYEKILNEFISTLLWLRFNSITVSHTRTKRLKNWIASDFHCVICYAQVENEHVECLSKKYKKA